MLVVLLVNCHLKLQSQQLYFSTVVCTDGNLLGLDLGELNYGSNYSNSLKSQKKTELYRKGTEKFWSQTRTERFHPSLFLFYVHLKLLIQTAGAKINSSI